MPPPSAPIDLALGVSSSAQLAEGDSVALFLTLVDIGLVPEKLEDRIVVDPQLGAISPLTRPTIVPAFEGFGVFRVDGDLGLNELGVGPGVSLDVLRRLAADVAASDGASLPLNVLRDPSG